jgi:transposase
MKKVIGMDLGDKKNVTVVFDEEGKEVEVAWISNTAKEMKKYFSKHPGAAVVMEAGTHSGWITRMLEKMDHEVCVGNPRKLRAIWDCDDKSDERDARILGLMYRLEPRLLHQIFHRGEQSQVDLEYIKSRNMLVEARTKLLVHVRCSVKGVGERIPKCSSESFSSKAQEYIPVSLREALQPMLDQIAKLTEQIKWYDKKINWMCKDRYPETRHLLQVQGVGPITALAFVLSIEDKNRFEKSRSVGAYMGMTPKRDQSGDTDKQLRITKAGDTYMRQLLVGCAHYILGPFGEDSELRRHGERIASKGGKNAKKRAVVAVARKLSVLLHRLWVDESEYVPLRKMRKVA